MRCINCGLATGRIKRHTISSLTVDIQSILNDWISIQLPQDGTVCHACFVLLHEESNGSTRKFGHVLVCLGCGRSLRNQRSHAIEPNSPITHIISLWNPEYQNSGSKILQLCHNCFTRAERQLQLPITESPPIPVSLNQQEKATEAMTEDLATIVLPNYKRAPNTSSRCIFKKCTSKSHHLIPVFIKEMLLKKHKYYVPIHARVCEKHLFSNEWHLLPEISNLGNCFTSNQIEDLIKITTRDTDAFDFEQVHEMPNYICHYWTGLNVLEFLSFLNDVPALNSIVSSRTALATYIIKLRTGDTNQRLSSLFNTPRSSLERRMKQVSDCLDENIVPLHIRDMITKMAKCYENKFTKRKKTTR